MLQLVAFTQVPTSYAMLLVARTILININYAREADNDMSAVEGFE